MDGIDVAVVDVNGDVCRVLHAHSRAYDPALRAELFAAVANPQSVALDRIGRLETALGQVFATAIVDELRDAGIAADRITAIGSHGQTLRHTPEGDLPFTWQIGDPNIIAERTGITTVADFRRRDLAAGGEGAPLMPAFHRAVLGSASEVRAVLNLGGIANLTLLTREGGTFGFDTGPASCLMDGWIERHRGKRYDENGDWAASGQVDQPLLERLLAEAYFARPWPKSTGRELFNMPWLDAHLRHGGKLAPADVQATLCELTAVSVAQAARKAGDAARLIVCGGGAHNAHLLRRLGAHLPNLSIEPSSVHGIDPDFVEATGFAWLASRTLAGKAGNIPSVTGARHSVILGAVYAGSVVTRL